MATGSAKNTTRAAKPIRTAAHAERIAEKIKQLKKNILKNRAPVNLVTDIENDVTQEEHALTSSDVSAATSHASANHRARMGSVESPNSVGSHVHTPQHYPYQQASPYSVQNSLLPPTVLGSVTPVSQIATPNYLHQGGDLQQQGPPLSYPGMSPQFPVQMQLQQDPRTGLFQLIPVMSGMPMQSPMSLATPPGGGHYIQSPLMQPHHSTPLHQRLSGDMTSHVAAMSPSFSGSSTDGERSDSQRAQRQNRKKTTRDRRTVATNSTNNGSLSSKVVASRQLQSHHGSDTDASARARTRKYTCTLRVNQIRCKQYGYYVYIVL